VQIPRKVLRKFTMRVVHIFYYLPLALKDFYELKLCENDSNIAIHDLQDSREIGLKSSSIAQQKKSVICISSMEQPRTHGAATHTWSSSQAQGTTESRDRVVTQTQKSRASLRANRERPGTNFRQVTELREGTRIFGTNQQTSGRHLTTKANRSSNPTQ